MTLAAPGMTVPIIPSATVTAEACVVPKAASPPCHQALPSFHVLQNKSQQHTVLFVSFSSLHLHHHGPSSDPHHFVSGQLPGFCSRLPDSGRTCLHPACAQLPRGALQNTKGKSPLKTRLRQAYDALLKPDPSNWTLRPISRSAALFNANGIHTKLFGAPQICRGALCLCVFAHYVPSVQNAFPCLDHLVTFHPVLEAEADHMQ